MNRELLRKRMLTQEALAVRRAKESEAFLFTAARLAREAADHRKSAASYRARLLMSDEEIALRRAKAKEAAEQRAAARRPKRRSVKLEGF